MRLSRKKKVGFALIAVVVFALLAELGVRLVCLVIGRTPYTVATPWMRADDELLFVFKPHFQGRIYDADARINNLGLRGDDVTQGKPPGAWRALCLGNSTTFGYSVKEGESYPARLQQRLRERYPDRRIEVLNAGTPSYTTYQGLRYLETRGLKFQPDVVVAAFGHNDGRFVLKPEQADGPAWFETAARGLRRRGRMRFSYAVLATMKIVRRFTHTDTWQEDVLGLPSQRLEDLNVRVDYEPYRENLRRLAKTCRDRGIAVVFVLMSDAPPVRNRLAEARRLREEKRYDEAIEVLSRIGRDPPDPQTRKWCRAIVLYEIGKTLEAQGRTEDAQAKFRESAQAAAFWSLSGGTPIRDPEQYVRIAREVAGESGAATVDVAERLSNRPELFSDHTHYTAEGHRLIAEAIAEILVEKGLPGEKDQVGQR